jgi:hypothetical protein
MIAMAVRKKRSISMPPDLDAEIAAAAAAQAGMSYSAWLADTARKEFTIRVGLVAVSRFEQDYGAFTPEELAEAEQWAATAVARASRSGAASATGLHKWASPTTPARLSPLTGGNAACGLVTAPC